MAICQGVLLDTVGIQSYVFQSNELKENIGASYIIGNLIYGYYLKEALNDIFPSIHIELDDLKKWKEPPFEEKGCKPFEIGYIGGGNALLLFEKPKDAKNFIKRWTRILMVRAPQVNTAVALAEFDLKKFYDSLKNLLHILRNNKLQFSPQTIVSAHGITAECTKTGLSSNISYKTPENEIKFVSSAAYAKIDALQQLKGSKDNINQKYQLITQKDFVFTDDIEQLGQIEGEDSHIAIVHIDGNDIGERFFNQKIDSLSKMREVSVKIDKIINRSFDELVWHIVENHSEMIDKMGFDDNSRDKKKRCPREKNGKKRKVIPVRPIIMGGDDLTFVCDGKMGIYFTEKYMKFFEEEAEKEFKEQKLTACAGIAIIKTKYPFFRGYSLAEQLCANAKKIRRQENSEREASQYSYLDFHIASGAIVGTLDEIRKTHFNSPQGRLYCRPYRMIEEIKDEKSLFLLIENAEKLKKSFPRNKLHELREVLTMNKTSSEHFLAAIKAREKRLPEIPSKSFEKNLFDSIKESGEDIPATPYMDMIELIEYYPFLALQDSENGTKI